MAKPQRHNAGALDIRAIIAYLVGIYGIVLVCFGIFDFSDEESAKTDGYNINLWAGLGMLVLSAVFLIWNRVNPTKVSEGQVEKDDDADNAAGSRDSDD